MKRLRIPYLNTIDRYIVGKYLSTFMFTMAIFTVVAVVFDVYERLDDFMKHDAPLAKIVSEYYSGVVPFSLNMVYHTINFTHDIFFPSKLEDQTQIFLIQ